MHFIDTHFILTDTAEVIQMVSDLLPPGEKEKETLIFV